MLEKWTDNNVWNPFLFTLYKAVNLCPTYTKEIYRAINCKYNIDDYKIGNTIVWSGFSICYKRWNLCSDYLNKNKIGIVFIVHGKNSRDISKYSKYSTDEEILFTPNTVFKIINHYKPNIICLQQENIRTSTFSIMHKDNDLEKAHNGKASIIIELEEIDNTNIITK